MEQLLQIWPEADIFVMCDVLPDSERGFLRGRPVRTSFIQRLPFARKHFRKYLGLMPIAVEQFDLAGYDLVVSSNHAVAKGVITGPGQLHVSYVHSPMRYAWDLQHQYLRQARLERGPMCAHTRWLLHRMRHWDRSSAAGVDSIVATQLHRRADREGLAPCLHRDPPAGRRVTASAWARRGRGHYLIAARSVPYKRVELVVEAFRAMPGRRLVVCGDGPGAALVRDAAAGAANVELRGRVPQAENWCS